MGKTLAEILADANADNELSFTGPDGLSFKLSDLRGTVSQQKAALEATLNKKISDAEAMGKEAATLLNGLKEAVARANGDKKTEEKKGASWEDDIIFQPILPVINELKSLIQDAKKEAATARTQLDRTSAFYAIERMRNEYDHAPESFRKAKTFEQAVADAIAAKDVLSYGQGDNVITMPTLTRRIKEGTEQERMDAYAADKIKEAEKKWEQKHKMETLTTKPGRFAVKKSGDKPPISKIEELTSELVANDPDIAAAMEGTSN